MTCALSAAFVEAASYAVNSTDDAADSNIGDGVCDADPGPAVSCTLRAAINEANSDTAADSITIPAGVYVLDIARAGGGSANDGDGETGDLDIDRDLVITGAGPGSTIISGAGLVGANTDRIFHFRGSGTDITLSGVTIEGGRYGGSGGAAIHNTAGGTINIDNVLVRDISAGASGAITNQGSGAGSAVNITRITNTTIMTSYGSNTGAILQDYSGTRTRTLELTNVTIASTSHGSFLNNRNGALRIDKGVADLNHVTLFNNRYGLDVEAAVVTVSNSLFVSNGDDATGRNCRTDIQPVDGDGLPSGGIIAGGTITSLGGNYSSDSSCSFFSLPSDTNAAGDPGVADMIADSGTVVVPFYSGSEVTSTAGCASTDQTGNARGATCVIGAYESSIAPATVLASPAGTPASISGVVFRDFNDNGQRGPGEPAVSGIRVSAFGASTTAIDTVLTDSNGQYSLATGSASVRIEFTNIPDWLEPGAAGIDSDTTIQFVQSPASNVNLSLFNPGQYCQNDPQLATSCYLIGDQSAYLTEDTVVGFNNSYGSGSRSDGSVIGENGFGSSGNPTGPWAYTDPSPAHLATGSMVGTTWGMAYQRTSGDLFVAAFHKRHAGQGPDGPGAIYRIDPSGLSPPSTLIVLADVATDPHASNGGDWSRDADAWDAVGRASLGDMDISDDDATLYVANLEARTLDVIDIASATRVNQVAIPDGLPGADTGCVASDVMPFAVAHNDGVSYLGLVCSASSTQTRSQLRAYVYDFDGSSFGAAPVLEFPLTYVRGESYGGDSYSLTASWRPWTPQAAAYAAQIPPGYFDQEVVAGDDDPIRAAYPQPMLADIEFDNGDMVLAVMDRTGHQQANLQGRPDGGSFIDADPAGSIDMVDNVEAAGDLLRACSDGAGGWEIERNASCGAVNTAGANNLEGYGGGEYYFEDAFLTAHPEVLMGGLEQIPGQPDVVYVAYDPILWSRDFNSGGIHWASNRFGSWQKGYRLYDTRPGQPTFAKANGLGDIEAMCSAAPIEIGNFVWIDTDKDGLQDPTETPVAGVFIGLFDAGGNLIAVVETSADGQYLFSSDSTRTDLNADADATPEFDYGVTGLMPRQDYTVAILDSNFSPGAVLDGWTLTVSDNTFNRRDSDAVSVAVGAGANTASNGVPVRTGLAGANNHTYDFGVIAPRYDLALVKTLKPAQSAWVLDGDSVDYEVEILNQGDVPSATFSVTDIIPFGMSYVQASGTDFVCALVPGAPPTTADEVLCSYSPPDANALAPGASAIIDLTLRVDDLTQAPFRNWAEIEEDSAASYGVIDDDSSPGDHNASDNGPGTGNDGSDPSIDHDDITHNGGDNYDEAAEDEDDSDPALVRAAATTPITLSSFKVSRDPDKKISIRWRTSTEEANLGFHLYAKDKGDWRRLNRSLIASRFIEDSDEPTRYARRYFDRGATVFAIADVDTSGNEILHGPFNLDRHYGKTTIERQAPSSDQMAETIAPQYRQARSVRHIYVDVERPGIHIVTYAQLRAAGIDWTGVDRRDIALSRRGDAVPRLIRGGSSFGRNSAVEFLVPAIADNRYAKRTRYMLSVDASKALEVRPLIESTTVAEPGARTANTKMVIDRDRYYSRLAPGQDPWYMDKLLSLGNTVEAGYDFDLRKLADAGSARLSIDVWGGNNDYAIDREHRVRVAVNGVYVGSRRFEGVTSQRIVTKVPMRVLKAGANTVTLSVRSQGRRHADLVYIDSLTLKYPRRLVDDEQFSFVTAGETRTVRLTNSVDGIVYRYLNGQTRRLRVVAQDSGTGVEASIAGTGEAGTVYVSSSRNAYRPVLHRAPQRGQLFSTEADYLVITHPKFRGNDLRRLVQAREAEGLRVKTVNTGWIYRDYSGGERDAEAIARYIDDAARRMGVRYVLLVGDDSYDYKNHLKRDSVSFLPSLYAPTDDRIRHVSVDPLYGDVDNDGVPDVSVGRMPVNTRSQLRTIVNKTLQYARSHGGASVVVASDENDGASQHSFRNDSQRIARSLNRRWTVTLANAQDIGIDRARRRIISAMNAGVRLVNYVGHSDRERWGFNGLFSARDLSLLDNADSPTVVTQFGCWNNDYTSIGTSTLGEQLLLRNENGAAAVIGSTTLLSVKAQAKLANLFYQQLNRPGTTIGEALVAAKSKLARRQLAKRQSIETVSNMLLGVIVLGDPAITPHPRQ